MTVHVGTESQPIYAFASLAVTAIIDCYRCHAPRSMTLAVLLWL